MPTKSVQDMIKSQQKMFSIVGAEGQPGLLAGVFRENYRLLAPEIEQTYLGLADNKQRIKTDLVAISQSVRALNIGEEITMVMH